MAAVIDDGNNDVPVVFRRRAAGRRSNAKCVFESEHACPCQKVLKAISGLARRNSAFADQQAESAPRNSAQQKIEGIPDPVSSIDQQGGGFDLASNANTIARFQGRPGFRRWRPVSFSPVNRKQQARHLPIRRICQILLQQAGDFHSRDTRFVSQELMSPRTMTAPIDPGYR
jgi:hypothetical protein